MSDQDQPVDESSIPRDDLVRILRLAEAAGGEYVDFAGSSDSAEFAAHAIRWAYLLGALGVSVDELET